MSVLGIDLGKKRIGLAISDESERIALPAGILSSRGRAADIAAIRSLVRERGVQRVVVGLPLHMNGRPGPEAEAAARLRGGAGRRARPARRDARRALVFGRGRTDLARDRTSRRKRRTGEADTLAATLLLRTFLERRARAEEQAP